MSIKTSQAIQDISDSLLRVPIIANIAASPFYLGLIIVIIIVLMAVYTFRDSDDLLQKSLHLIFWGGLATTILLILRDRSNAVSSGVKVGAAKLDEAFEPVVSNDTNGHLMTRAGTFTADADRPLSTSDADKPLISARQLDTILATRSPGTRVRSPVIGISEADRNLIAQM